MDRSYSLMRQHWILHEIQKFLCNIFSKFLLSYIKQMSIEVQLP